MQSDKDRLEIIKEVVKNNHVFIRPVDYLWKNEKYFDVEVDWLIEQAEKVNQLEEENKKLLEYAIDTRDGVEYWNSKYKDSNKKLERYEKALKEIRDGLLESPYFDSFKVAKQALEESE